MLGFVSMGHGNSSFVLLVFGAIIAASDTH
jgi:hypothetical protein